MPIPSPRKGESNDSFMGRCMGDKTMLADYSDPKQRAAVCYSSLRDARGPSAGKPPSKAMAGCPMGGDCPMDPGDETCPEGADCPMGMGGRKWVGVDVHRAYSVLEVKSAKDDQRIIHGTATTPSTDRMGDIVEPLGISVPKHTPLLWQHDRDKPVGVVTFAKPTKDGMQFEAQLPHVTE